MIETPAVASRTAKIILTAMPTAVQIGVALAKFGLAIDELSAKASTSRSTMLNSGIIGKNTTDGDAHRRPDKRCPGKVRLGDRRVVTKSQHEQVNDVDQRYHRQKYRQNPATKVLI